MVAPLSYESSQARSQIGSVAASLPQPQQWKIWAASGTYTTAHGNARSSTHWARPVIKPSFSWILSGFITVEPQRELQRNNILKISVCIGLFLCGFATHYLQVEREKKKKRKSNLLKYNVFPSGHMDHLTPEPKLFCFFTYNLILGPSVYFKSNQRVYFKSNQRVSDSAPNLSLGVKKCTLSDF